MKPLAAHCAMEQTIIKKTILQKRNCWRTYKYGKVKTVMQVKFKFEDPPLNQIWQDDFKKLSRINKNEMYKKLKGDKPKTITFEEIAEIMIILI